MTRDAKLYFLEYHGYKPLVNAIQSNKNYNLKNLLTIFQLPDKNGENEWYAVLSLSNETDKIAEEFGAAEASENDCMRNTLHDYHGEPIYGEKTNLIYLNKVP